MYAFINSKRIFARILCATLTICDLNMKMENQKPVAFTQSSIWKVFLCKCNLFDVFYSSLENILDALICTKT